MIELARIVLRLLAELADLVVLSLKARRSIEAEHLFLRRELALYQERGVNSRRVAAAVGVAPAIDPEGMGGSLQPRTPAHGARSRSVLGGLHHEHLPVPASA